MPLIRWLTEEEVIEINRLVLREIRVSRADQPRLLSKNTLREALAKARDADEEVFEAASSLLIGLIRLHPFASGNRRTAYVAVRMFLEINGNQLATSQDPKVLLGIREGFYTADEVKQWLKGYGIKKFERG